MQELEQRLKRKLLQNSKVQIMNTTCWSIPIQSIQVECLPVKRLKMDVLMKMVLLSFQKGEIRSAATLSELLLVEQLFIEDLIESLTRTGLIEKVDHFVLTRKGLSQLKDGIFEEEQKIESHILLYSPCHTSFLHADLDSMPEFEEPPELFRYAEEDVDESPIFQASEVIEALELVREPGDEGTVQTVIADIISTEQLQINDIPCIEFILYEKDKDIIYTRIWNTLLAQWDEVLEKQLMDKELVTWRNVYLDK